MKQLINFVWILAVIASMLVGCKSKPTAKEVIVKSYQKCESIEGGHYKMLVKKKYMSMPELLMETQ